jgi:D-alanine-D-alanine ligase
MRVIILCHRDFKPPSHVKSESHADNSIWRTEFYVRESLLRSGHEVRVCAVGDSFVPLERLIQKFKPDVVFNLLEEFAGEGRLEHLVVSFLERLGQPYTGNSALGLILAKNKIAAKVILASHKIDVPGHSKFPKIVKLIDEESSRGISETSIVKNDREEKSQKLRLSKKYKSFVFSEEYIEGRELHVGVLNTCGKRMATPIWETTFGKKLGAPIISEKVKWDFEFRKRMNIQLGPAVKLLPSLVIKIQKIAIKSCKVLEVDSYARVDMRLDSRGKIYVLEVNPNPDISKGDEFAECVRESGLEYDEMIECFLDEAMK